LIAACVAFISGFASVLLHLYSRYLYFASQALPDTTYGTYVDIYKQGQEFVDKTLNLSDFQKYLGLSFLGK
jgi:hypothetical protein